MTPDLERAIAFVEAAADALQGQGLHDHIERAALLRVAGEMRRHFGLAGDGEEERR